MVNAKISLSLRQESSLRNSLEVICISVWNQAEYPCWKTKSKSADDAVKTSDFALIHLVQSNVNKDGGWSYQGHMMDIKCLFSRLTQCLININILQSAPVIED